jgi:hypothetical protein
MDELVDEDDLFDCAKRSLDFVLSGAMLGFLFA